MRAILADRATRSDELGKGRGGPMCLLSNGIPLNRKSELRRGGNMGGVAVMSRAMYRASDTVKSLVKSWDDHRV